MGHAEASLALLELERATLAPDVSEPSPLLGPVTHTIGTEGFPTVSSGASFAQVAGAILQLQALVQNPDKDEAAGSSPARPTTPGLTCDNARPLSLRPRPRPCVACAQRSHNASL